jgi:hypothetical protein
VIVDHALAELLDGVRGAFSEASLPSSTSAMLPRTASNHELAVTGRHAGGGLRLLGWLGRGLLRHHGRGTTRAAATASAIAVRSNLMVVSLLRALFRGQGGPTRP